MASTAANREDGGNQDQVMEGYPQRILRARVYEVAAKRRWSRQHAYLSVWAIRYCSNAKTYSQFSRSSSGAHLTKWCSCPPNSCSAG